jgi:SAM-dependent methyltransferase/GNAT superfamily N-acetyltransferase
MKRDSQNTPSALVESELDRIRSVYAQRDLHVDERRYTPFDPAHMILHHSREKALLSILKRNGIYSLSDLRILDVGCGAAGVLLEYMDYGAKPQDLFGIDLLPDKLLRGHERSPNLRLFCADGQNLPCADHSFDIVTSYTVFTSVLDASSRGRMASEMIRVLKSDGLIICYDFWPNNPRNPNVRGIHLWELKRLFPHSRYDVRRIVLGPPISRRLAPFAPLLCQLLEKIPILCSHYMLGINPQRNGEISRVEAKNGAGIEILPMKRSHLGDVVKIHMRSFHTFFLTFLGSRFLGLLYDELLKCPGRVAFVARDRKGSILGFVTGVSRQGGFYANLIRYRWAAFAFAASGAILRRPSIIPRLARALNYPRLTESASSPALLMSIAVEPGSFGGGIGQKLLEAFMEAMRRQNVRIVSLTTDRDENERTNRFYLRYGFKLARTFVTPEGRWMNEYVFDLRAGAANR